MVGTVTPNLAAPIHQTAVTSLYRPGGQAGLTARWLASRRAAQRASYKGYEREGPARERIASAGRRGQGYSASRTSDLRQLVGYSRIDERLKLPAEVERAGGEELGHEDHAEVFGGIDPEDSRRRAAPHVLAGRADDLGGRRSLCDTDGETQAHSSETHFA